jgi:MoxR-like ATPase
VRLVVATRDPARFGAGDLKSRLAYGASPRATLGLVAAARALALLRGREYVLPNDITDLAVDVLSHRLVLSFDAVADGVAQEDVVRRLVEAVPPPQIAPHQAEQAA